MSRISRDPYNVVICGVGGQGNILISKVIGNAVLRKGYCVTVVDDIGASQRAGMVTSKIRISPGKSCGPLIPEGQAHLVLGLEPLETLRMLYRYGNPDVLTLTNIAPIFPAEVLSRRVQYPDMDKLKKSISSLSQRVWFVNATRTALDLGAVIVTNVVLLGALIALNEIPLTRNDTESELRTYLPAQKLNINLEALRLGYEMPGVQNMTNNPRMRWTGKKLMKPELIADCQCRIGESPIWHPLEKRLYWVFIPRGLVLRFDPVNGKHYITKQTKEPLFYNLIFVFSES